MAGVVGVDPVDMSLRELVWAFRGRRATNAGMLANLCAVIANVHAGSRSRRWSARDFLPPDLVRAERSRRRVRHWSIDEFKSFFRSTGMHVP